MTKGEYVAVAAICATIAGSTWLQGQRITDLRADMTRQVDLLRADMTEMRADIREIRNLLVAHLAEHPTDD